jgi:hypothetical protein
MSKKELGEICRNVGIAHSNKKKEALIKILLEYYAPDPETEKEYLQTKRELESKGFSTSAPQHSLYREEFNAVDLFDKQYYKCVSPYPIHNWRTKMFFALFEVFLINSFTLYREIVPKNDAISLRNYRKIIGMRLLIFNDEDYELFQA